MVRCLVINGTVGVGKTTAAEAIGRRWRHRGLPGAVIDVDWLRYAWPAPGDDPFNATLGLENLAALAANHVAHGAQWLVVADVIESVPARRRQADALRRVAGDLQVRMVRLVADAELVRSRIAARHRDDADDGEAARWHLHRVQELADILTGAEVEDAVVEVTGLGPQAVAERVLAAAGWDEPGAL